MQTTNYETILGFNPVSDTIGVRQVDVTPQMASMILVQLNKDNRKIVNSQVTKISKSIREDGWLEDGQPLTFNREGNITEGQHRLHAIISEDVTVPMIVVTGVTLDCFTRCAPAKPRRPEDEIQRKDKLAKPAEVSALRQLLSRRRGEKLNMKNAIEQWNFWREDVRAGRDLVDDFFDSTTDFDPYERTFSAWAALCVRMGYKETAETLLSCLKAEILDDDSVSCLTREFIKYFKEYNWNMPAAGRTELIYQLLCVATDRLLKKPNGDIQLGVTPDKMNHTSLSNSGTYRKFLDDPDGIGDEPYFKDGFDPDN